MPDSIPYFLRGGGEMSRRIHEYNWSATELGPVGSWPVSLKTTLGILLHSKFPMFLYWGENLIQFYNDAYRVSLGENGKHPQALGQQARECWPDVWHIIGPVIEQVMNGGEANWTENQVFTVNRNGRTEQAYWTYSYSQVAGEDGTPAGVFVTCTETTKMVTSITSLEESKNQLRFAIDASELGTWDYNPKTNTFTANERLKGWFGLEPHHEIDLNLAIDIIAERDRRRVTRAITDALNPELGGGYDIEYTIVHPETQQERIVRAQGKATFGSDGIAYRFNGIMQDVTEGVIARRKLENSERRFRSMVQYAPVAMGMLTGGEKSLERANLPMLQLIGKGEGVVGKPLLEFLPELESQDVFATLEKVFETGEPFMGHEVSTHLFAAESMVERYFDLSFTPLFSEGRVTSVLVVAVEVTSQVLDRRRMKAVEAVIRNSAERLEMALDAGSLGSYEYILRSGDIVCTDSCKRDFGLASEDELNFRKLVSLVLPEDRKRLQSAVRASVENKAIYNTEFRVRRADDTVRWVRAAGKPVYDGNGRPLKIVGITLDITEQKVFSEELAKQVQERTAELKRSNDDLLQFAHVISHDLREPVRKIKLFTSRVTDEYGTSIPEGGKVFLGKVHNAADRMLSMIEGVLTYSMITSQEESMGLVDLNKVIQDVESDLEVVIASKNASVYKGDLPAIEGAYVLLHQLFYNIVNNALKFLKKNEPGVIRISAQPSERNGRKMVAITVQDNGIGFDEAYNSKIFNTFTRLNSKDKYEGTGLGLALCRKIAERHSGFVRASGVPGVGASFVITLPVSQHI